MKLFALLHSKIRLNFREAAGACGDIGVLVPILLSLAVVNGVDLSRTLILAGLAYIGAGLFFRLPVPVQPLKAMAAIALAQGLELNVIRAASLWMGVLFLAMAWSGGVRRLSGAFPTVIVKGLQLGVGLLLVKAAWRLLTPASVPAAPVWLPASGLTPNDFWMALFVLVLPQIPLTLGNAVFGASDALRCYFGRRARRATPERLAFSIGWINLAAGIFQGYPLCHGSGGVTAHARLGARGAGATVFIGTVCISLALLFGPNAHGLLSQIPKAVLGGLLVFVGISHCRLFLELTSSSERRIALGMGLTGFLSGHLGWALVVGWAIQSAVRLRSRALAV